MKLDTKPGADVTVTPASGDTDVATVSPPPLTFTPTDWNTAQEVTVTGAEDDDGVDEEVTITHTAESTDTEYAGITIGSVVVSVEDDDPFGVTVTEAALDVVEGATGTYQVKLDTKPGADVTVTPASGDTDVATVSPPTLTFTPTDWNAAQEVTVSAEQDEDGSDATSTITHRATSTDTNYNGISPIGSVVVSVEDDDPFGVTVTEAALDVAEGSMGTYQVRLDTKPGADVTVTPASGDTDVATVSPPTLTFTPTDWNAAQEVTVSAEQDEDGSDATSTITHRATSTDTNYNGISPIGSVVVSVEDDDPLGVMVDPTSLTVIEGGTATYRVKLDTRPSAPVTISMTSTNGDVQVPSTPLSFTGGATGNWNTFQTVTVEIAQDTNTSDESGTITHTASSDDSDYSGITIASVSVRVNDNDELPKPTITSFTPTSGLPGDIVTINGTHFDGATAVRFSLWSASSFTVVSSTEIRATVSMAARTGQINVTTPGGTATSAGRFTVRPYITNLSPTSGPPRTWVTITGMNFGSSLRNLGTVTFNGASSGAFTQWTPTSIRTWVGDSATSGPVVVTSSENGTSSNSDKQFTVTTSATGSISVSPESSSPCTIAVGASTCSVDLSWTAANTDTVQVRIRPFPYIASDTVLFTGGGTSGTVTATIQSNEYSVSLWDVTPGRRPGRLDSLDISASAE